MAKNKRTEIEIIRDREEIAELYVRRTPQHRIAEILNQRRRDEHEAAVKKQDEQIARAMKNVKAGDPIPAFDVEVPQPYELTRQMIGYDLNAIRADWVKNTRNSLNEAIARQLASIDEMERVAWEGYERSCKERDSYEKQQTSFVRDAEEIENPLDPERKRIIPGRSETRTVEKRKRFKLTGDPRWLAAVDRALARRERLLGLFAEAPGQHFPHDPDGESQDILLVQGFDPASWLTPQTAPAADDSSPK